MFRFKTMILASLLLGAATAWAQDKTPGPAPMGDADACMKHCREMAAHHQKAASDRKATMEKNAAAWKEIRAAVDTAKKSRGDKKVAALETALDRLVSFHESMMAGMSSGPMPGMGGMACCGEMGGGRAMAHGMDCCGGEKAMADCCAHESHGMSDDCPMMKKGN